MSEPEIEKMDKKSLCSDDVDSDSRPTELKKSDYGSTRERNAADSQAEPVELLSCRRILYLMMFLGVAVSYSLRVALSEAIVAMVNQTAVNEKAMTINVSDEVYECPRDPSLQHSSGEYVWDRQQQATVLAAFYYGYILTQVFGGWLADRFGGKWLFGGGILSTSVLTLLTPAAADVDVLAVVVLRALEGAFEGFMLPSTHALLSRWTPDRQITRAVTIAFSGQEVGIVVGMLLGGLLSDYGFAGGWPSVFYVFGTVGCLWFAAWFLLVHNSPWTHPRISKAEREYLASAISNIVGNSTDDKPRTPWRKIFTSGPLLSCCVAKFAHNWGYHTMLEGLPLFYFDVLGFNMSANGLSASLPFLAAAIMMIVVGVLSDWMRAPGRLSSTVVRKITLTCGLVLPSLFFISSGFLGCNRLLVVLTLIVALGFAAFAWACVISNSLDLSKTHAATLLGITNSTATLASLIAPHVFGGLTYHYSNREQWRKVFYVVAGIEWIGTIVYLLFGSGESQDWEDDAK